MVKKIYYYVVLFATLIMTIGGSVSSVMAIADIVTPQAYYQSYESFKEMKRMSPKEATAEKQPVELSEQELRALYNELVNAEKAHARTRAVNSLIKSLAWVIIPLPVFIYFQRKVQKLDKE